ncbi:hypothetical protein CAV_1567 [Campylobacter avium LMG 24591]|uniref:Uncharacterized protein n=1 Tax=Campylobacter avium LMG 24591 TaxID=522484 RepID=A0A222MUU6_9BACT|nr:hypothetical protein [Campylobacter avium]ASQ29723.1 hypothetical protein CAV_0041 [Campylobacter avium LMG 24591]ASQ31173.1 hypothetical protein CAV_1567 [Campylobacter avium LMG 24591]OYD78821.1 hypothetical protein CAV8706_0042 [Campylobacter avium]
MGEIEDSTSDLKPGDDVTVILKRDPSKDGNIFGQGSNVDFTYSGRSGTAKLALQKDPSTFSSSQGSDMSYYIEGDIFINPGSQLIMNLDSTGSKGLFKLDEGAIKVYNSSLEINDVNNFVIDTTQGGGGITVSNGSTLYK